MLSRSIVHQLISKGLEEGCGLVKYVYERSTFSQKKVYERVSFLLCQKGKQKSKKLQKANRLGRSLPIGSLQCRRILIKRAPSWILQYGGEFTIASFKENACTAGYPVGNFVEYPWENDAKRLKGTSYSVKQLTIVVEKREGLYMKSTCKWQGERNSRQKQRTSR